MLVCFVHVQLAFLAADIFASFRLLPLSRLRAYTLQDATFYTCSYFCAGNSTISTVKSRYSHCFSCHFLTKLIMPAQRL